MSEQAAGGVQMPLAGAALLNRTIHQGDAHGGQRHGPKTVRTQVKGYGSDHPPSRSKRQRASQAA